MIDKKIQEILGLQLTPLDYLPQDDIRENIVDLVLRGVPGHVHKKVNKPLLELRHKLLEESVEHVKVVVFGGGTGLSNIIGGDSRRSGWAEKPFSGLKEIFPHTKSIVCVTDNGGSTGELMKDLPLVAIGDMRHVLLSSIQLSNLQKESNLNSTRAVGIASILSFVFNKRFTRKFTRDSNDFKELRLEFKKLPLDLCTYLSDLLDDLFKDSRLSASLNRPNCLGNLLIATEIYREVDEKISNADLARDLEILHKAMYRGLNRLAQNIGAGRRAVLPCTSTPAQLRVRYTNGVEGVGEHKLSQTRRGVPVDSVQVDYFDTIRIYDEVFSDIAEADILLLAPGSLYSSIIPVFKVPGIAEAVRNNKKALKILVSNLWVQAGETDFSIADPERKFHVSDMIRAYEKNIPGGTKGLFNEVLCLSLGDIPASILQKYAVEGKVPIYLDREELLKQEFTPIECGVYSKEALNEREVIQHDPETLALAIKGLYNGRSCFHVTDGEGKDKSPINAPSTSVALLCSPGLQPCQRFLSISKWLNGLLVHTDNVKKDSIKDLRALIGEILWDHPVMPLSHLQYIKGIYFVDQKSWDRDQQWDNVYSFYDPNSKCVKIRSDQSDSRHSLEVALMVAIGESLLGNYANRKVMEDVRLDSVLLGRAYHLYLKTEEERQCFLNHDQLHLFLELSRMCVTTNKNHYTRLLNKGEGFTPPGLLMGLMYAWYVNNKLATHIEYKMSVMKISHTDLIPEQLKMAGRRQKMVQYFREIIFCEDSSPIPG